MSWRLLSGILWELVCIIVILGVAYWLTRKRGGLGFYSMARRTGPALQLELIAQVGVGGNERLVVVKTGERYFLLGVTAGGISNLAELSEEDVAAWREIAAANASSKNGAFADTMNALLKKKGQR